MNTNENITKHFSRAELACRHCGELHMDQKFLEKLELVRMAFGKPMIITSGYRCEEHNAAVSEGRQLGAHTLGFAVDVAISGEDVPKLIELALKFGFTGFGLKQHGPIQGRYVHLDTVSLGSQKIPRPRLWTYP
ncbi:MAG: DUF882 domain-containing protein [Magnetococcales bacterium]|nr:DUF882 domain-containing protein [Magnetococcales bacterium]